MNIKLLRYVIVILILLMSVIYEKTFTQNSITKEQQIQSLVNRVTNWRLQNRIELGTEEHEGKCGLGITFEILSNFSAMSPSQQKTIQKLLEPPPRHTFKKSGNFTVFYDTTGWHVPSMLTVDFKRLLADTSIKNHKDSMNVIARYVDSTLAIFNYVWEYTVNILGYIPPPFKTGKNTYEVYITELGSGIYGQTVPEGNPINPDPGQFPPRYNSYIEIDNDFISVYPSSRGMPGLKVTAAHEFHHAVQLGGYGFRAQDMYFYEITSTWIEDVIYNDINDYYQYIKNSAGQPRGHFANPGKSFIATDRVIEYSRAIWGKYIQERFSTTVMRRTWELMGINSTNQNSIKSLDDALKQIDSTLNLKIAFVEFAKWNYYTGNKAVPGSYYSEALNYPLIKECPTIELIGSSRTYTDSIETFSSLYLPVLYQGKKATEIINNINFVSASNHLILPYRFDYIMSSTMIDESYRDLGNGVFVMLYVPDPMNWSIGGFITTTQRSVVVFPNPFVTERNKSIQFLLPSTKDITSKLYVYTSNMELVFSNEYLINNQELKINWNGIDARGNMLNSGIYLYVIILNNREYVGKFAVVRR
jgi:hypothetical protein